MEMGKQTKLSKMVLDMKFMKKTKERVEKEADDAEGQAMYSKEITEAMKKSGNTLFLNVSITNCKDLIDGRLSFGGMNPDVEKIMSNTYVRKMEEVEKAKEKEVTDADMAKGYSTLNQTVGKKFQTKSQRNSGANRKFMRPQPME